MRVSFMLLMAILAVLTAPRVHARDAVVLDAALRETISRATLIQGPPLTPESLNRGPVVVTFFASWCPPCRVEFDVLASVRASHNDGSLRMVAINVHEDFGEDPGGARLRRFLLRADPSISVVRGTPEIRQAFGGIDRIPTLYVFDRGGKPVFRFVHERGAKVMSVDEKTLNAAIQMAR